MGKLLALLGGYIVSSAIAKIALTLGIGLFTYQGLYSLIERLLNEARTAFGTMPEAVIQLSTLAGIPEGLSIICSAVLTRAALNSMKTFIGVIS